MEQRRAGERIGAKTTGTKALVVGPYLTRQAAPGAAARSTAARLSEAEGLARAIELVVDEVLHAPISAPVPATYLGKGKVAEIAAKVKERAIGLVVVDCALSPVQQRNLEKAWATKVIDRTGLILEIFGERARTREGALQVELAHLAYQKSRLVRSWTHLERQRGGFGFLGGPGETQIETDRRLIQERMRSIEKALEEVKRTRGLHRKNRERVPYPVVALVGYTNAGKSTLFNRLTKADVLAKDMLFATLDPTVRALRLPRGMKIVVSDTVGFISELPTMLVAAFRATLEDVRSAALILHVRDVAHEDSEAQNQDVRQVLATLGIEAGEDRPIFEVWNKADLLAADEKARLIAKAKSSDATATPCLVISAVTGEGVEQLLERIEAHFAQARATYSLSLNATDGKLMHWLHEIGEVLERRSSADGRVFAVVRVADMHREELERRIPNARAR